MAKRQPLESLHEAWCAALDAAFGDRVVSTAFPVGYEPAYVVGRTDCRRLLLVCPWHWQQYSHYQFWELAAAAFLGRQDGYAEWSLLTNAVWTPWILPAFERLFGALLVVDEAGLVPTVVRWLDGSPTAATLPPDRPLGRVLLGTTDPNATTVSLKDRLGAGGDRALPLVPGEAIPTGLPGMAIKTTFAAADGRVLVAVKGFRNPDPVHEAKMMAGRGFLCPPDRRLVVVVDGRFGDAPALIARSGADVCTPDRLAEALRDPR